MIIVLKNDAVMISIVMIIKKNNYTNDNNNYT